MTEKAGFRTGFLFVAGPVSELFENETDAKNIIKYKEVLSVLESATDKCKNAASVLESIAVKHS